MRLHVFSDYACPWCYLGRAYLKEAMQSRHVEPVVVHFPLSPDTPAEGRLVVPYLRSRGVDPLASAARLSTLFREAGLPWYDDVHTLRAYPTRLAQELAAWAVEQPGGEAIHDALFSAYQVDNVNVGERDVLVGIAESVGLDGAAARRALGDSRWSEVVDAHGVAAQRAGVTSVPTFVAGQRGLVGAQPAAVLLRLLDDAEA